MPNKKIAIPQSNYTLWKGCFDLINSLDEFVLWLCTIYKLNKKSKK
jgi:hypothetical protein